MICDFCCDPDALVRWSYPVNRDLDPSGDDWAACHRCHGDIEAGDWEAVLERSLANYTRQRGEGEAIAREGIAKLFAQFQRARIGPAYQEPWDIGVLHE